MPRDIQRARVFRKENAGPSFVFRNMPAACCCLSVPTAGGQW